MKFSLQSSAEPCAPMVFLGHRAAQFNKGAALVRVEVHERLQVGDLAAQHHKLILERRPSESALALELLAQELDGGAQLTSRHGWRK